MTATPALVWIDEADALAIHDRSLAVHGGRTGLRDRGLLLAALARPVQHANYGRGTGVIELAAAYAVGLVRNHPFIDGNKRVGFVVCVLFLELNGYRFTADENAASEAVLALASGTMDEAGFTAFLREHSEA